MELQVGVKALLKNPEGKFLLLHRSPIKYPEATGRWDLVGGRINPGTTLLENLEREIKEETGLKIIGKPQLLVAQDILRLENKHVVRLTYLAETEGEPKLDGTENDQFLWLTLDELKNTNDLDIYLKQLMNGDSSLL